MNIYFFLYNIYAISIAVFITYYKCVYDMSFFDNLLIINYDTINMTNITKFVLFRVIVNVILGILFSIDGVYLAVFKILMVEIIILYGRQCKFEYNENDIKSSSVSIMLSIISYYIGSYIHSYINI